MFGTIFPLSPKSVLIPTHVQHINKKILAMSQLDFLSLSLLYILFCASVGGISFLVIGAYVAKKNQLTGPTWQFRNPAQSVEKMHLIDMINEVIIEDPRMAHVYMDKDAFKWKHDTHTNRHCRMRPSR